MGMSMKGQGHRQGHRPCDWAGSRAVEQQERAGSEWGSRAMSEAISQRKKHVFWSGWGKMADDATCVLDRYRAVCIASCTEGCIAVCIGGHSCMHA